MGTTTCTERAAPEEATRPALRSPPGGSAGLPVPVTPLVDRDRELALTQARIRRPEVRPMPQTGPTARGHAP